MTEKKRELIKTIAVIPSNFEYIAKTGIINGTLLVEIERVMEAYAAQQNPDLGGNVKKFAAQQKSEIKLPTEPIERWDAEAWLGKERDIWHHPRISDRTDNNSYEVADLMAEFAQEFATLHAQKIAEKMVSERLRGELMDYEIWRNGQGNDAIAQIESYMIAMSLQTKTNKNGSAKI